MENGKNKPPAERLRCETCLYWEDFNGVCFCGASPYCADFTDGDAGAAAPAEAGGRGAQTGMLPGMRV